MKKQKDDKKIDDEPDLGDTFKEVINKVKTYIQRDDFISDASFEIGKSFRVVRNTCVEIFNDLME